ncbi:MAG: hypothetical protein ACXWQ5_03135 [Ktedonobacterales bacterium]
MPFTATTFNSGGAPGIDSGVLNTIQLQYLEATNSFEQDMFTPWVLSGFVATKDGTVASQLDVTSGIAFLTQTDGTERRRNAGALNYSTSGHPSTTMYLDLNPDGTWSWNTAHSGVANYLPIASVTTDASANIATVTDARPLGTTLFSGMTGTLTLSKLTVSGTLSLSNLSSNGTLTLTDTSATNTTVLNTVIPVAPGSDQIIYGTQVSCDAGSRIGMYIRGDGYGGIKGGAGGASTGYLYTTSAGWQTDNAFTVNNALSVNGNLSATGNATLARITADGGNVTTDGSGTLSVKSTAGTFKWNGTLSGTNRSMLTFAPTDASTKVWGLFYNASDNSLSFYDSTDNVVALRMFTTGVVSSASTLQQNGVNVAIQGAHSAGQPIVSYGTGAPASLAANEIYIQLA